jgi:hypothetical protein
VSFRYFYFVLTLFAAIIPGYCTLDMLGVRVIAGLASVVAAAFSMVAADYSVFNRANGVWRNVDPDIL